MNRIKLRITVVIALAVFLLKGTDTFAQQTDPTLTGAVFAQTSTLKNIYDKRQKAHEKIIAAETAVTVALDRGTQCGGQDAGISFQCTGCHAESLSD